ncbi:YceI family protein [Methylobacterium sp. JK268]
MKRVPALACLLVALALPARAQEGAAPSADPNQVRAGRYRLDPAHGKVTWSLSHLGYSTYYGQITGLSADLDLDPKALAQATLRVRVPVANVNALDDALNRRLGEPDFLDAAHFPEASFVSRGVETTGPTTARVSGDFTLKGVTKPLTLDATFNQAGIHPVDKLYTLGFDGRAVIRRSDFGITAFLPGVGDEVTLRLEGEFKAVP